MADFEIKDGSQERIAPTISRLLDEAISMAEEYSDAGQETDEACSIAANLFIVTAWRVAQIGALSKGRDPDAEKFRNAVNVMLERNPATSWTEINEDEETD